MKTSNAIIIGISVLVVGGLGALLLSQKKKPQNSPPYPPTPPTPTLPPDPVAPAPVVPAVPQVSESDKYDRKINNAAAQLYQALEEENYGTGLDATGAGADIFWQITRSLDKDEREDVADVYDDDWGNLCTAIEGDFTWDDETRALKKYGYPSGNSVYSNC